MLMPRVWHRHPRELTANHHLALGAMGGVATTPVINYPKSQSSGSTRSWCGRFDGQQFIPAKMMNLSSSFDHRVITLTRRSSSAPQGAAETLR